MYTSSQTANTAILIAILIAVAIAVILAIVRSRKSEKPRDSEEHSAKEKTEAAPPDPTYMSDVEGESDEPRVVTSFPSKEKDSSKVKTMTPSEAEFKQLLIWDSASNDIRTCEYCGAEIRRTLSTCPACGQTS